MKITMYELLGMIKDGKANDITTDFIFDGEKYNLSKFLDTYALDINSLNWKIEILEEEKKIPEKIDNFIISVGRVDDSNIEEYIQKLFEQQYEVFNKINEIIDYLDYLKSKGE